MTGGQKVQRLAYSLLPFRPAGPVTGPSVNDRPKSMPHPHLQDTLKLAPGGLSSSAANRTDLVIAAEAGLYCPPGDFYIDPWQPVARAVVTHAHSDHAAFGAGSYLTAEAGKQALRVRVGGESRVDSLPYGEPLRINDVTLSFHPAGHILGSAQVR